MALRVLSQVLNIARLTIVLRILAPYDLGLLGIGTLMIGMVTSFTDLGLQAALVQRKDLTPGHLNCVWTVNLARSVLLFLLVWIIAPWAARFFDGDGDFGPGDIVNYRSIAAQLEGADPLSTYIRGELSGDTRRMLAEYEPTEEASPELRRALTADFGRIVRDPDLGRPRHLSGLTPSGYLKHLISQAPETRDTVRSNRRLLDEAFAGAVKRDIIDRRTVALVIRVLALTILLGGIQNVGVVYFTKDLAFHKYFSLQMVTEFAATGTTIVMVLVVRSVWALVVGRIAGALCGCAASYLMHPFRPRLRFSWLEARQLWHFGRHVMGISILKFLCLHGDDVLLGRMLGATALGLYQQAYRVGQMVATELGNKIADVAFPAYSKLQDNLEKMRGGYFKALQLSSVTVFPVAGGLIALAPEITEHVFGARWLPMVPAMQILCLVGPLRCMQRAPVFMAIGRPDIITRITALRFILLAVSIYPLTLKWGMTGTALSVAGTGFLMQPVGMRQMRRLVGIREWDNLKILAYPAGATALMMAAVYGGKTLLPEGPVSLLALVGLGAVVYASVILAVSRVSRTYDAVALFGDIIKGLKP